MAIVSYNGCAITPAPLCTIDKEITLTPDGTRIGTLYNITITGKIVSHKGSPQAGTLNGVGWGGYNNLFWVNSGYPPDESISSDGRLHATEIKQAALRALFSTDGQWLQFQSPDGSTPLKCQPRVINIDFAEGIWYEVCDYTIHLTADVLYLNGSPEVDFPNNTELVSSASEQWQIEDAEVAKTYRLSHSCSAVGKRQFDSTGNQVGLAWQQAKSFVQNRFALGFNNTTTFSPIAGQSIVANSFTGSGNKINFSSLNAYNYARNEVVDEWAGSYSLTESWTLSQAASGTDVYNVSVEKIVGDPQTTTHVTIQGVIHGFFTQLGDYDGRFAAAQYQWAQTVGTPLLNRATAYAGNVTINPHALAAAVDYNPLEGTVSYQYRFSDRPQTMDAFDEWVISKRQQMEDYRTVIGIQGKVTGRTYEGDTSDQRAARAIAYWNTISPIPILYNRIVNSNYFPEVSGLRQYPIAVNVDINAAEGVIQYNYEFNNRQNDNDTNDDDVFEDYTVSSQFSREEGKTLYGINGNIQGLKITDVNPRVQKYNSANNYWNNVVQNLILSRLATNFAAVIYNQNPIATQVEKNPSLGTVQYSYQYSNEPAPLTPGAFSEVITVSDSNRNGTVNSFASIGVLGRVAGPVLQNISTTKEKVRNLEIEVVVVPTGGANIAASYALKPNTDFIVNAMSPVGQVFLDDDVENWVWNRGRYSRSTRWVWQ